VSIAFKGSRKKSGVMLTLKVVSSIADMRDILMKRLPREDLFFKLAIAGLQRAADHGSASIGQEWRSRLGGDL
jgi:hypothetical protein